MNRPPPAFATLVAAAVNALAAASLDDVRAAWAGLGYYSRARNLHRTALIIAGEPPANVLFHCETFVPTITLGL